MAVYGTEVHLYVEADSKEEAETFLAEVFDAAFDLTDPPRLVGTIRGSAVFEDEDMEAYLNGEDE